MKSLLRKTLAAAIGACSLAVAIQASALTIGDAYYVGSIIPDQPSNPEDEAAYINIMIGLATATSTTFERPPVGPDNDGAIIRSSVVIAGLTPIPIPLVGNQKDDTSPSNMVDVTGYSYILAKYGQDAHVWYVGGLTGVVEVPADMGQGGGLSHWSLYGSGTGTSVPDGGSSLLLLGSAFAAFGFLRRKLS